MVKIRGAQIEDGSISETELDAALAAKVNAAVVPDDLGGAAVLDVGTTAGTVAAGDHGHLNHANVYNVRAYGATGDGVTDDTAAFEAAEAALPTEGGVIYVPAGTYVVSYRIRRANVTLRGASWDAILKTPPGATSLDNDAAVRILADYVTVENLQIDGNKANNAAIDDFTLGEHADGVGMYGNYGTVRNCYIHDTIGHKVISWNEAFTDSGGASSVSAARTGIQIEGNLCTGVGQRAAIDIASTHLDGSNVTYGCIVANNRVEDMPIIFHTVHDSVITGNSIRVSGKDQYAISVHTGSKRIVISDNVIHGASVGINLSSSVAATEEDIVVAGNKVYDTASSGILVSNFNRVRIVDNVLTSTGTDGVLATNGTNLTVSGNVVSLVTNGVNAGNALVRYALISGNSISDVTGPAVSLAIVQDTTIADNVIETCLVGVSAANTNGARLAISRNRIAGATSLGINCRTANSTVTDNDLESVADSIYLDANDLTATGNRIGSASGTGIRVLNTPTGIVIAHNRVNSTGTKVLGMQADTVVLDNTGYTETTARQISVGTTAQRPTAAAGLIRYNSTTGLPEFSNATAWNPLAPSSAISPESDPASHGYLGWTFPAASATGHGAVCVDGTLYAIKIWVPKTIAVTGIALMQDATVLSNPDNYNGLALYSSAGVLLGKSADQATPWAGGLALRTAALTAEAGQSLTITGGPGVFVYGAILCNSNAGTVPGFYFMNTTDLLINSGLVGTAGAPTYVCGRITSQTAMPATLGALSTSASFLWMALY